jgi:hypothetical protein
MSEFYQSPQGAVLKCLQKGHPLYVEYSRSAGQPSVILASALFWGLYHNNELALFVAVRRENKNKEEWFPEFNWVQVDHITVLRHDAGIKIDTEKRKLSKDPIPLIYDDHKPGCEAIDAAIKYHIERKLFEMNMIAEKPVPPGASQIAAAVVTGAPQIVPESAPQPVPAPIYASAQTPVDVETTPVFDTSEQL